MPREREKKVLEGGTGQGCEASQGDGAQREGGDGGWEGGWGMLLGLVEELPLVLGATDRQ